MKARLADWPRRGAHTERHARGEEGDDGSSQEGSQEIHRRASELGRSRYDDPATAVKTQDTEVPDDIIPDRAARHNNAGRPSEPGHASNALGSFKHVEPGSQQANAAAGCGLSALVWTPFGRAVRAGTACSYS